MRRDLQGAHIADEAARVVAAVGTDAHAPASRAAALTRQKPQAGLALSDAVRLGQLAVDDQPVAILGQAVAGVAELRRLAAPLAREARLGVGRRAMGRVRAPLSAPVDLGVASAAASRRLVLALLERPQALECGSRLDERSVQGEALAPEQLVCLGLGADRREEGLRTLSGEQAVTVLW
jgi:hypothetical protein